MNIIFVLALVVWLQKIDPSVSVRLRENSNTLVPSNDVNLHDKIKTLLNGEEIDPEDFSDNEIESLSKAHNVEIEKLRHKNLEKVVTMVFDDKNKNIEDNLVDRDVESFQPLPPPRPGDHGPLNPPKPPTGPPPTGLPFPSTSAQESVHESTTPNSTISHWTTSGGEHTSAVITPTVNGTVTTPSNATTVDESTTPIWTLSTRDSTASGGEYTPTVPTNSSNETTTSGSYARTTPLPATLITTDATTPQFPSTTSSESVTTPASTESPVDDECYLHPENKNETQFAETFGDSYQSIDSSKTLDECLLRSTEKNLRWVTVDGKLNVTFASRGEKTLDLSRKFRSYCNIAADGFNRDFENITFLSAAYNNLVVIPNVLLSKSTDHLKYLSLAGNNFSRSDNTSDFKELPHLQELDLRNCGMVVLRSSFLKELKNLETVYLSYNRISVIQAAPFPKSITNIDLSNNTGGFLSIDEHAFSNMSRLAILDLSFTQLDAASNSAFENLPGSITQLSLCYTQLSASLNLKSCGSIETLDISGNPQLHLTPSFFANFATSLESLDAKNSNVKSLSWTENLRNLKYLNLYDNNIHNISNAFSHMTRLEILDLEKNSIGNWYVRLFHENTVLTVLNLRENKLISLSDDMKVDMSHVESLALGKNDFECRCDLEEFMHELFEATKAAQFIEPLQDSSNEIESVEDERISEKIPDSTRPSFGARNYIRPEYDVISRTYQKYYEMAEESHRALQSRSYYIDKRHPSNEFVLQSKSKAASTKAKAARTILFDYNELEGNYQCINITSKELQKIVEMHDLCIADRSEQSEEDSAQYKASLFLTLSISLPLLIGLCILLVVAYWKWWYIKYFFVICKNSAILTFMDDSDGGNDAIIKKDDAVDVYLYDVFVSYCEQNREWVLDEFIPNIEKRESINVCLHERDFMVGCGILENIVSCMDRSRCLLLLVSENFLLSQWCQFEMNLAQHRLLETRRDKLIIVLLEDIPVSKQPKTLKYLMRTKTYIKWPGSGSNSEKQLFWKRLKKAITTSKWENESYGSMA